MRGVCSCARIPLCVGRRRDEGDGEDAAASCPQPVNRAAAAFENHF